MTPIRTIGLLAALAIASTAQAAVFTFETPPFAGTTALETPGRQIVGNELFIPVFDFQTDVLALNTAVFGIEDGIRFFSGTADAIPASGFNFVVLQTFDGDGDPLNGNQLGAGGAANLIADRIETSAPGFFIYFNSGLDLPRLVFSTDLGSSEADLKIVARFTGLTGEDGRNAMPSFAGSNVAAVPEPATWAMLILGFGLVGRAARRRVEAVTA